MKSSFPQLRKTLKVGWQPSGIAVSKDGKFALVAYRDSKSITMLLIDGTTFSVWEKISTEDSVGAIAITRACHRNENCGPQGDPALSKIHRRL